MTEQTLKNILSAHDQHKQALQNFNYADQDHVDKAIQELTSTKDKLTLLLCEAIKEVRDIA